LKGTLRPEFGPTAFSKVIFGIAAIMSHIHSLRIILRDLQPSSIFLDDRNEPQLGNLFLARLESEYRNRTSTGSALNMQYMAPELRNYHEFTSAVDVYSYGLILYAIFADTLNFYHVLHVFHLWAKVLSGMRPTLPQGIPAGISDLINTCWDAEPSRRPSFAQITQMMLERNYFVLDGTNLEEYREYQQRITSQLNDSPIVDDSGILESLRTLGIDVDSMTELRH
jgi:serine/threonine protein kinase